MGKFIVYLLLLAFCLLLYLPFFDDLLQQAFGGPDWFVKINTAGGLFPLSMLVFILMLLVALVSGVRLIQQVLQKDTGNIYFLLRAITAGSACLAVLLMSLIMNVRPSAWKAYNHALTASVSQLRPGMTPARAEARLEALHPKERDKSQSSENGDTVHSFGNSYGLGGLDANEFRSVKLVYGRNGKLKAWKYMRSVFVDQPLECELLSEYPSKGAYPRPCDKEQQASVKESHELPS